LGWRGKEEDGGEMRERIKIKEKKKGNKKVIIF
jgi:hypothetical protein